MLYLILLAQKNSSIFLFPIVSYSKTNNHKQYLDIISSILRKSQHICKFDCPLYLNGKLRF